MFRALFLDYDRTSATRGNKRSNLKGDTSHAGGQMNKSKMLSFRLDESLLRKVDQLRLSRHRTRGEIIREALQMYFRVHNPEIVRRR